MFWAAWQTIRMGFIVQYNTPGPSSEHEATATNMKSCELYFSLPITTWFLISQNQSR